MIHVIIGTKAQLIKMAPILKQLQVQGIQYNYILTGQHKDTVGDIANNFNLKQPDYILYSRKRYYFDSENGYLVCKMSYQNYF